MSAELPVPGFETRSADWLSVEDATARILVGCVPLPSETLELQQALGRALAEELSATATLPPWDNSAVDGYAVRSEDVAFASPATPVALAVVGRVRAGEGPGPPVGPAQAVRIMTGAPLPREADCVVKVEDTDAEAAAGHVQVVRRLEPRSNVRAGGEDMREGDLVLEAGCAVTPGVVGVLAALGRASVRVHRVPSVAILATGDELRGPERYDDVRAGLGVPESNGPMLCAMVAAAGAHPLYLGVGRDDPEELRARIAGSADADVLVTVGGASMGEADLVKRVLDDLGFRAEFWRVRMRPGSPFGFGRMVRGSRQQPVFGLPGNPVSAFVTFEVFVRPFLLRLAGHRASLRRTLTCVAAERLPAPADLTFFLRVAIDASSAPPRARLVGPQGSGLVKGLGTTQGLAIVPEGVREIGSGQEVGVLLLDDGPGAVAPEGS